MHTAAGLNKGFNPFSKEDLIKTKENTLQIRAITERLRCKLELVRSNPSSIALEKLEKGVNAARDARKTGIQIACLLYYPSNEKEARRKLLYLADNSFLELVELQEELGITLIKNPNHSNELIKGSRVYADYLRAAEENLEIIGEMHAVAIAYHTERANQPQRIELQEAQGPEAPGLFKEENDMRSNLVAIDIGDSKSEAQLLADIKREVTQKSWWFLGMGELIIYSDSQNKIQSKHVPLGISLLYNELLLNKSDEEKIQAIAKIAGERSANSSWMPRFFSTRFSSTQRFYNRIEQRTSCYKP